MDPYMEQAVRNIKRSNTGVLLAMGALFVSAMSATRAMNQLGEMLREHIQEEEPRSEDEEVDHQLEKIVEEHCKGVN